MPITSLDDMKNQIVSGMREEFEPLWKTNQEQFVKISLEFQKIAKVLEDHEQRIKRLEDRFGFPHNIKNIPKEIRK